MENVSTARKWLPSGTKPCSDWNNTFTRLDWMKRSWTSFKLRAPQFFCVRAVRSFPPTAIYFASTVRLNVAPSALFLDNRAGYDPHSLSYLRVPSAPS